MRCTVFPIDNLGSARDGRYTIAIAAPGFASQNVMVDVTATENPGHEPCFCYYDARAVPITLAP